jgi:hypothetical protein
MSNKEEEELGKNTHNPKKFRARTHDKENNIKRQTIHTPCRQA